jgi:hypothetical protein
MRVFASPNPLPSSILIVPKKTPTPTSSKFDPEESDFARRAAEVEKEINIPGDNIA